MQKKISENVRVFAKQAKLQKALRQSGLNIHFVLGLFEELPPDSKDAASDVFEKWKSEIAALIANADNHVRKCTGTNGLIKNVIEVMTSHVDAHFAKLAVQKTCTEDSANSEENTENNVTETTRQMNWKCKLSDTV